MKTSLMSRSRILTGLTGLLRMDGAAVSCFRGSFFGIVLGLAVVVAFSIATFLFLAPIVPGLIVDHWSVLRVALTEACQYLVIINFIEVMATKWDRQGRWSRCAEAILWATALANMLTLFAVLIGRLANLFLLHDTSSRAVFLSGVILGFSLYLIITMCRILRIGLQVSWRQVAAVMLGSLFASMLVVQLPAVLNGDLNKEISPRQNGVPTVQK